MNSKKSNIQSAQTRKDWRKSVRRAARLRKKNAKRAICEKHAAEPKRYDLLAQYSANLASSVRTIIQENKIKYTILTDYYFVISNLSEGACKEIESAFSKCIQDRGKARKPLTVRFAKWKSKTIIADTPSSSSPTNNTKKVKRLARTRRKTKNIQNFKTRLTKAEKASLGRGRSAKKIKYRFRKHDGKIVTKVRPSIQESSTQKKIRNRAKKAIKYILKREKTTLKMKKSCNRKKKAIQQKFNFAA